MPHYNHSIRFTAENITHISCTLQSGKLASQTTCVDICYSIMLDINERLKSAKIRTEVPQKLKSVHQLVVVPARDDYWEFGETFGLSYEVSPDCVRIITEDGHCIEIELPVFLELWDRYFKQSERVKKDVQKKIATL